jgi:hypothetical protein
VPNDYSDIGRVRCSAHGRFDVGGKRIVGPASYDASWPVTVTGPIVASKCANSYASITVKAEEEVLTLTPAPIARMQRRGAPRELDAGNPVTALGHPSTVDKDEMRSRAHRRRRQDRRDAMTL